MSPAPVGIALASVGCTGTRCFAWISGRRSNDLTAYMHETGHNLGLQHSGRAGSSFEYADLSCTMGLGLTCFNAANMWRLGWLSPLPGADLTGDTLGVGRPRRFSLPSQNSAPQSLIRIDPTWTYPGRAMLDSETVAPAPVFYVALRVKDPPFELLDPPADRVYVYTSQATQAANSYVGTFVQAILDNGEEFRAEMPYGLVVRVWSVSSGGSAIVSICRAGGASEAQGGNSCSDGRDNDCDGLVVGLEAVM
ncbi:hypothetical protein Vretifemale_16668, partial [Volvox reticuliferus]